MRNSALGMSQHDPLFPLNFANKHANLPILHAAGILKKQPTQMIRCETSAPYKISQRPPPGRR